MNISSCLAVAHRVKLRTQKIICVLKALNSSVGERWRVQLSGIWLMIFLYYPDFLTLKSTRLHPHDPSLETALHDKVDVVFIRMRQKKKCWNWAHGDNTDALQRRKPENIFNVKKKSSLFCAWCLNRFQSSPKKAKKAHEKWKKKKVTFEYFPSLVIASLLRAVMAGRQN